MRVSSVGVGDTSSTADRVVVGWVVASLSLLSTWFEFVRRPTSRSGLFAALALFAATETGFLEPSWPSVHAGTRFARLSGGSPEAVHVAAGSSPDDALIRAQPFCVAEEGFMAGELASVVLYRTFRVDDALYVGYFVHWSTERPWGENSLTRQVLPALAIDAFYSHFLFVLPGAQRVLYGPGDIEGVLVRYRASGERLVPEAALADDERHHAVTLSPWDLEAESGRVTVLTDTWSHQLGAREAARRAAPARTRCFEGDALRPLTEDLAQRFRLGTAAAPRRARPAWASSIEAPVARHAANR